MAPDARRARIATTLVFLLTGLLLGTWATQVAPLRERLSLSASALGLVLLCAALGALLTMPLSGRLIARFGAGRVIQAGATLSCAMLVCATLAPSWPLLCAALFAFGAGFGTVDVAMNAEAVAVERRAGRPVLSSVHAMWSLGALCGSVGGSALLTVLAPGQQAVAVAIPLVAALLGAGLMLHRLALAGVDGATDGRPPGGPAALASLWTRPALLLTGALMCLSFAVEGAVLDWGAVYLRDTRHVPLASAALGFSAFSMAMMATRFIGDRLRVRLGDAGVLQASLLAAAGFAVVLAAPGLPLALCGFALAGAGVANVVPVLFSLAGTQGAGTQGDRALRESTPPGQPAMARNRTGDAVGIASTLGYAGVLGGPPLFGLLAQATSVGSALAAAGLLCAAVGLAGGATARLTLRPAR